MKHIPVFLLFVSLVCSTKAAVPDVKVYLEADPGIPAATMDRALLLTKAMFHGIGVEVAWSWSSGDARVLSVAAGGPVEINLCVEAASDRTSLPGALAYASPYGDGARSITVMYDRMEPTILAWPALSAPLLAHVMAHEITHVLEATDGHSGIGLMKAHWTKDDYWQMSVKGLKIAEQDVAAIRAGLAARRSRPAQTTSIT
jgi:hypothetical protein